MKGEEPLIWENNILVFPESKNGSRSRFLRYSELQNYPIPTGIRLSKFTPPAKLRMVIEGAEIFDDKPIIQCGMWGVGEHSSARLSLDVIRNTDFFIFGEKVTRIERQSLQNMLGLLEAADISSLKDISLRQYIDLVRNDSEGIIDYSSLKNVNIAELKDLIAPVSSSLFQGTPYDFQNDGIRWMWLLCKEKLGLILGDEMGLGKTFQIIFLFCLFKDKLNLPSLVICPATLVKNWCSEIEKFAPDLKVYEHKGPYRSGSSDFIGKHDVVITSYDTLIANEGELRYVIGPINWSLVVLDEAQAIKNPEARRSIVVKQLDSHARIAVTGTPLENTVMDVWSLFDFCLPRFLGELEVFNERFPNSIDSATRLESAITPFILRRLISEVKEDLPERIDMIHGVEFNDYENEKYDQYIMQITDGGGEESIGLSHIQKLRVFCTHPNIYLDEFTLDDFTKFQRLIEILSEIKQREQKVVIFTSFTGMIDRFCEYLPKYFPDASNQKLPMVEYIDGRNSERALDIIDKFSDEEGFAILALNPRAAGTGLTITAANHVIHYNPEWNPALMSQATARVHRIGQDLPVVAHWMYCRDTIEERIIGTLDFKRQLFEEAIQGVQGDSDDEEALIRAALGMEENEDV